MRTYRCTGEQGAIAVTGTASAGPDTSTEVADAVEAPVGAPSLTVTQRIEGAPESATPQARAGESVSYRITARNTGAAPLRRVVLRDQLFAGCDGAELGALAPGARAFYRCVVPAPVDDVTHVAVAVGELADGAPVRAVSEPARLAIVRPGLAVSVLAAPTEAAPGEPIRWSIAVKNTGDTDLRGLLVDASFDGCDQTIGRLKAGAEPVRLSCVTTMETVTVTNVVTVTGRPGAGDTVQAVASATTTVHDGTGLGGPGVPDAPAPGATPEPSPGVPASPTPSLPPATEPSATPSVEPSPSPTPSPPPPTDPTPSPTP